MLRRFQKRQESRYGRGDGGMKEIAKAAVLWCELAKLGCASVWGSGLTHGDGNIISRV